MDPNRDRRRRGAPNDEEPEEQEEVLDNESINRVKEIQRLPAIEKNKILSVIDALIRDFKARQSFGITQ